MGEAGMISCARQFAPVARALFPGSRLRHSRNGVNQFAIGNIFQAVEREPLAITPGGVVPAGENCEVLLALTHRLGHRSQRTRGLPYFLVERHGLALESVECHAPRALPGAVANEPEFDSLWFGGARDGN